jgi:hypothetical protein
MSIRVLFVPKSKKKRNSTEKEVEKVALALGIRLRHGLSSAGDLIAREA